MARIENHKFTIEQAFKECFYIVPDYQREYVWTEKQVGQLLRDIDDGVDASSSENPSEYFIGTILVSPQENRKYFDVIDGQQRLTTIFLILCALRALFKDKQLQGQEALISGLINSRDTGIRGDIETNLRLDPQYENAHQVIKTLVEVNGNPQLIRTKIQTLGINTHGSIGNILNAYEIIYDFLTTTYNNDERLINCWGHLANNVVFIQISTDVSSALKIFETVNERGVSLNSMDLLKNLLFTQVSTEEFSMLKIKWKEITNLLEENKEKPLRFLRYFLMANYTIKNKRKDSTIREDEIYAWFSAKENIELTDYKEAPFELVRHITKNAKSYIHFSNSRGNDGNQNFAMDSLKQLTGGAFSQHYVLLLAAANLPKNMFDQFVSQLESFLFYYLFTKTQAKELENKLSGWSAKLRDIACIENQEKQRDSLNRFINDYFKKDMQEKAPELNDALRRLTLYSMQKYRIKYLLARLAQHVEMAFTGQANRENLGSYFNLDIEHILPNNPSEDFRRSWEEKHLELDYDEMKTRLGNLTLLERPINSSVGNGPYSNKVSEYANSANYLTRSLAGLSEVGQNTSITRINEKLSSFERWDAEDIEKRQSLLIALVHDIWKISEIK